MSDNELVTLSERQFNYFAQQLAAGVNALWEIKVQLAKGDNKKLDAIIELLQAQKAELEIIHGLVQNGGNSGADQTKIDGVTEGFKSSTDALDSAVKTQQQPTKQEN